MSSMLLVLEFSLTFVGLSIAAIYGSHPEQCPKYRIFTGVGTVAFTVGLYFLANLGGKQPLWSNALALFSGLILLAAYFEKDIVCLFSRGKGMNPCLIL